MKIIPPERAAHVPGPTRPKTVEEYIARAPKGARETLEGLRRVIRASAKEATEDMRYQVPTYRYKGLLLAFGATPRWCALYTFSQEVTDLFEDDFWEYDMTPAVIRFPHSAPPPAELIQRLVWGRLRMNDPDRWSKPKTTRGPNKKKTAKTAKTGETKKKLVKARRTAKAPARRSS
ncbi:MAG TPA: DUF1801 domain-containing protein [Polyangiaceae bacterium]|nr:DUF1801 domain-containing protein [Polyangiaceae bacterium]